MAYAGVDINATYGSTAGGSVFVPEMWAKAVKGYFELPTTFLSLADTSLSGTLQTLTNKMALPPTRTRIH